MQYEILDQSPCYNQFKLLHILVECGLLDGNRPEKVKVIVHGSSFQIMNNYNGLSVLISHDRIHFCNRVEYNYKETETDVLVGLIADFLCLPMRVYGGDS